MKLFAPIALVTIVTAAGTCSAVGPFPITIDQSQSTVTARLCIIGTCTTDNSPVSGSFMISLDQPVNPSEMSFNDFHMNVTESLTLNISFGLLGRFNSMASGLRVAYADPGVEFGPVPITSDQFEFLQVPTEADGNITYSATGIVCSALQNAGRNCNDAIDLADLGVNNADSVAGEFTVSNGIATMTGEIHMVLPLDPENPDLGSIEITGNIVARGPVPAGCPGDFNGDSQVDFFDYLDFAAAFDSEDASADFNGDEQVDFFDYLDFVQEFAEGCD